MEKALEIRPFHQLKRLRVVQLGAVLSAAVLITSRPAWNEDALAHEVIEMVGLALVLACVFGRLWSILYVGGKKNEELVAVGPYSISRNPLYFFSTIGAIGIGMMFGSLIAAIVLGTAIYAVFAFTASKEAMFLRAKFGATYEAYEARTPLFWPNPFLYAESADARFSPRALKRTFRDGLFFLAFFPALEFVEYLRDIGVMPTLLRLY